jgi:hypothetical protein
MTKSRQLHAPFVELERLLEREIAFLERLDERIELRDSGFKVLDRWVHHWSVCVVRIVRGRRSRVVRAVRGVP